MSSPRQPRGCSPLGTHIRSDMAAPRQEGARTVGQAWRRSVEIPRVGGWGVSSSERPPRCSPWGTLASADVAVPRPGSTLKQRPPAEAPATLFTIPPLSPPTVTGTGATGLHQLAERAVAADRGQLGLSGQVMITESDADALSSGSEEPSEAPSAADGWSWWEKPEALSAGRPAASSTGSNGTHGPLIGCVEDLQLRSSVLKHISVDSYAARKWPIGGEDGRWGSPYSPGASRDAGRACLTPMAVTSAGSSSQSSNVHGHLKPSSDLLERLKPICPRRALLKSSTLPPQALVTTRELSNGGGNRSVRSVDIDRQSPPLHSGRHASSNSEPFTDRHLRYHSVLRSELYGLGGYLSETQHEVQSGICAAVQPEGDPASRAGVHPSQKLQSALPPNIAEIRVCPSEQPARNERWRHL